MSGRRRIRVLFFNHAQALGGAELSLLDILAHLDRERFEPKLLAPGAGSLTAKAREIGIEVLAVHIPARTLGWRKYRSAQGIGSLAIEALAVIPSVLRLTSILGSENPDILYTNSQKAHVLGGLAGRLAGVPVVWHLRDILQQSGLRTLMAALGRWLPRRIIAVSQAVGYQFSQPASIRKITVIHNGIDIESIRARARAIGPGRIRKRFRIPPKAMLVGMVGRIAPGKGQRMFIEAAQLIATELPPARFLIAGGALFGEEDYLREAKALAGTRGLDGRLLFIGHVDNPCPIMAALDVLVHCPAEPEAFGRTVAEAMALGVPVVASRCGAIPEIIDDGRDGLLVEPADPRALAVAVMRILGDPVLARELRNNGPRKIASRFTVQRTVRSVESMLQMLVDKKLNDLEISV